MSLKRYKIQFSCNKEQLHEILLWLHTHVGYEGYPDHESSKWYVYYSTLPSIVINNRDHTYCIELADTEHAVLFRMVWNEIIIE